MTLTVRAAIGSAIDIFLHDLIGEQLFRRIREVEIASNERRVGVTQSALGIRVRIPKCEADANTN